MAEYQNIFTQVQVRAAPEMGMVEGVELSNRTKGAGFSSLALAQPALAQDAAAPAPADQAAAAAPAQPEEGGLEEIVVTAQKRAENLQSVPVSVTPMSS